MKKQWKLLTYILASAFVLVSLLSLKQPLQAVASEDRVLVVGSGLSEPQVEETKKALGVDGDTSLRVEVVNAADLLRYVRQTTDDSQMISSVLVTFKEEGSSVSTEIRTPENIQQIRSYQYSNAAITAGIYDCLIEVASIKPVTGESALAGIYKAAEAADIELEEDKLIAGQEELDTVNEIEQENKENDDFDSEDFSKAITEIKNEIAIKIEDNSTNIQTGDITVIINNVLNQYNIKLPEEDVEKLSNSLAMYKDSLNEEDLQKVQEQLKVFGEKAWNIAVDTYTKAEDSGILDSIGQFFKDLWEAIMGWFS